MVLAVATKIKKVQRTTPQGGRGLKLPGVRRDPDQAWFWTKEWQEKEREADEDIKAGRLSGPYRTAEEFIHELEK